LLLKYRTKLRSISNSLEFNIYTQYLSNPVFINNILIGYVLSDNGIYKRVSRIITVAASNNSYLGAQYNKFIIIFLILGAVIKLYIIHPYLLLKYRAKLHSMYNILDFDIYTQYLSNTVFINNILIGYVLSDNGIYKRVSRIITVAASNNSYLWTQYNKFITMFSILDAGTKGGTLYYLINNKKC